MTSLTGSQKNELQLLLSKNNILLPLFDKFVEQKITKGLLLNADSILLDRIESKLSLTVGEFEALYLVIDTR